MALLLGAGPAFAQVAESAQTEQPGSGLADIIVTAQRRTENLQNVPISVTAVSGEAIMAANATTFTDIARLAPSVQVGGQQGNQLVIRGIGQQQPGLFSEQGAAIFVDGVYRPRFQLNSVNFSDVERLEVLRGPQGTLYGKNAVGGALNILSSVPGKDLAAYFDGQYGSRRHVKVSGAVNVPIVSDVVALRLAADYNTQDGYIKNINLGERLNDTHYYTLRGTLRVAPSENLEVLLRGDYLKQNQSGPGYIFLGGASRSPTATFAANDVILNSYYLGLGYRNTAGTPSYNTAKDRGVSATVNWNIGLGTLTSITAYRRFFADSVFDGDGTAVAARGSPTLVDEKEFTQEVRLTGGLDNGFLKWTVGGFYYREKGDQRASLADNLDRPPFAITSTTFRFQDSKSYAGFGEITVTPFEGLSLIGGLRYTEDKKYVTARTINPLTNVTTISVSGRSKWDSTTYRLTAQYNFAPKIMVYGTVSSGFKAGGFNSSTSYFLPFGSEKVTNYEAGLKSQFLDNRVRLNLTVYQMDYKDIQLNQLVFLPSPPAAPGTTAPVVTNAGDARIRGGELELTVAPVDNLRFNAGLGLTDFKSTRLNAGAQVPANYVLPNSPKYSTNLGGEYTFTNVGGGDLVFRADYSRRSKTYFDASNTERTAQSAYGLLSGRITYQSSGGKWAAYLYGTNLTDKYYTITAQQAAGVAAIVVGAPREIGVGFRMNLGQ